MGIGLAVGWVGTRLLRRVETPVIENTVLLILPFAAYLPSDKLDASGVLAVVATGLYFGRYGSRSLTAAARLQQRQIWELVVFLLTGLSFLLVGLELRPVLETLTPRTSGSLVVESLAVVGTVVVLRLVWMFGATALPGGRTLFSTNQGTPATWRETTVVGWAGMRGAISLAAALALPTSFAERDLVLFLTFAVIVATLVGQGLTLPPLIRRLGLVSAGEQEQVLAAEARRRLAVLALTRIDDLAAAGGTPDDVTERVRTGYEALLAQVDRRLDAAVRGRGGRGRRPVRPPRARPVPSRPRSNSAAWSSNSSGTSSTAWWPGARCPSRWPPRSGPPSTSTRRPCGPDHHPAGPASPDTPKGASGEAPFG